MTTNKRKGLGRGLEALLDVPAADLETVTKENTDDSALRALPIDQIKRGQYQPRVHFEPEALETLANSIKAQGVLQPIVVRAKAGGYEIVAGERRWRAAQLAGLHDIPAVICDLPDETVAAVSLIENIQREDLKPLEEAMAFKRLIDEFEMTHQEVADAVSRSRASVTNLLRLLDLSADVKALLDEGLLDMGHARALHSLPEASQTQIARKVASERLSVRETEKLVKQALQPATSSKATQRVDPDIKRLEDNLSDKLAAKVTINHAANGKGKLIIQYKSSDELEGILKRFD